MSGSARQDRPGINARAMRTKPTEGAEELVNRVVLPDMAYAKISYMMVQTVSLQELRCGGQVPRWRLFYHVVWATEGRQALITPLIEPVIHRQLRDIAQRHGIVVHAIGGVEDHVHMAISVPPKLSVADAVRRIKGGSSHAIRASLGPTFGWQSEYSVDSFSQRHLNYVVAYVENQRQHHRDQTLIDHIEPIPDVDQLS